MKRIISILMLTLMILLTSCGGEVPELISFIDETASGTDYGGAKIIISSEGNEMNEKETAWTGLLGFDLNTSYGDALKSRIEDIENSINVEVGFHNFPGADDAKIFLMAGSYFCDIINYTGMGAMQNFAKAGVLMPMTGFDAIDLSETDKYGGANILEGAMIKSVPYAVQPVSWPGWEPGECTTVIYNREIMEQNNITDPHEFWENETWTWDTFEQVYLDELDLRSEELFNLSCSEKMIYYGFAYSNDLQWVTIGADGQYVVNAKPQNLYEALQEGADWVNNYGDKIDLYSDFWSHDDFDNGEAFMTLAGADLPGDTDITFEASIMPFPCGPSCEYGIWGQAIQRIQGFGIPTSSNDPEVAAHTLSLLFEPLDEYIGNLEDYYKQFMFNTETDVDIYLSLLENVRYDYTFDGGSDLFRGVNNNFSSSIKAGKSATETVDTYATQVTSIVEKYVYENYDYMYKNYYSQRTAD